MPATATQVFDSLDRHPSFPTERLEISLAGFGALRRSLPTIVVSLREGGGYESTGARNPVSRRLPRETLMEGLFVIRPLLGDVDLGDQRAGQASTVGFGRRTSLRSSAMIPRS